MEYYLEMLLLERMNQVKADLPHTHPEFAYVINQCNDLLEIIDPIINRNQDITVCAEDLKDIRAYIDGLDKQYVILEEVLYRQGFFDCICLLKDLGVLA